ncbi:MAG: S1 RNA-binding domain-containing protein, partial [Shimia sp.]|nr:S1 RNA-binding domain-containing protein [Shimia sp.]
VGVHQDGLVHVSQLADRFVKDPHEVVKAGDVVKVTVVEVDAPRKRIGLSMRKDGGASAKQDRNARGGFDRGNGGPRGAGPKGGRPQGGKPKADSGNGALGAALLDAMKKR